MKFANRAINGESNKCDMGFMSLTYRCAWIEESVNRESKDAVLTKSVIWCLEYYEFLIERSLIVVRVHMFDVTTPKYNAFKLD